MKALKNAGASVHQRLLNLARQTGRPFNELAQYYALERWLYRLAQSDYRNLFILKGALMLLAWKMPVTRPTRDIDLLGRVSNDLASIPEVIASICQIPTKSDGMVFDSGTVTTERITKDADYEWSSRHFLGNAWQYTSPDADRHRFQRCHHAETRGHSLPDNSWISCP